MAMKTLVLDIDGVMTTGRFLYTENEGKYIKEFGADDNDGLSLLKPYLDIHFVTGGNPRTLSKSTGECPSPSGKHLRNARKGISGGTHTTETTGAKTNYF